MKKGLLPVGQLQFRNVGRASEELSSAELRGVNQDAETAAARFCTASAAAAMTQQILLKIKELAAAEREVFAILKIKWHKQNEQVGA